MADVTPPGEGPPPLGHAVDRPIDYLVWAPYLGGEGPLSAAHVVDRAILDTCYLHMQAYRRHRDGHVAPLAGFLNKAGPMSAGPAPSRREATWQDAESGTSPRDVPGPPGRAGRVVELD